MLVNIKHSNQLFVWVIILLRHQSVESEMLWVILWPAFILISYSIICDVLLVFSSQSLVMPTGMTAAVSLWKSETQACPTKTKDTGTWNKTEMTKWIEKQVFMLKRQHSMVISVVNNFYKGKRAVLLNTHNFISILSLRLLYESEGLYTLSHNNIWYPFIFKIQYEYAIFCWQIRHLGIM